MAGKSKPLNKRNIPRPVEKKKGSKPSGNPHWLISNLLGLIATFILINGIILKQDYYIWVKNMLMDNHTFIQSHPELSVKERLYAKLGASYELFDNILSMTPDTAVIYLPGKTAFYPPNVKSTFKGDPYNKLWAVRFLYPRKVVIPSEMGKTSYSRNISHVTIVYGSGTELLDYKLPAPLDFGILLKDSLILKNN